MKTKTLNHNYEEEDGVFAWKLTSPHHELGVMHIPGINIELIDVPSSLVGEYITSRIFQWEGELLMKLRSA